MSGFESYERITINGDEAIYLHVYVRDTERQTEEINICG